MRNSALARKFNDDEYEDDTTYYTETARTQTTTRRRNFVRSLPFTVVEADALELTDVDSYAVTEPEETEAALAEVESWPLLPTNGASKPRQWTSGSPFEVAAPSSHSTTRSWEVRTVETTKIQNYAAPSYQSTLRPRRVKTQPIINYSVQQPGQEIAHEIVESLNIARQAVMQAYTEVVPPRPKPARTVAAPTVPAFEYSSEYATSEAFGYEQHNRLALGDWLATVSDWVGRNKRTWGLLLVAMLGLWLVWQIGFTLKSGTTDSGQIFAYGGQISVNPSDASKAAPTSSSSDVVLGAPSVTPQQIDQILNHYHSPATGVGQAMYDLGVKYGIDPAYALAFFIHESSAGTNGVATVTKSIGNIRATAGYASYEGFRKYPTWEAGIEDWFKLIKDLYVNGWHLTTLQMIIPRYAPSADHNDPLAYINNVHNLVASWRSNKQ